MRYEFGKPSRAEYGTELGMSLLDAFVEVSQHIPVAGVPEVVRVAVSLIKSCEVSA